MVRSISIVEYKVQQAHFFLDQIEASAFNFFAVQCLTDAFASACRTITLSMQSVLNEIEGFQQWYRPRADLLKNDPVSRFFNTYRVASVHIGDTVVRGGTGYKGDDGKIHRQYFFMAVPDVPIVPDADVLTVCKIHFTNLLALVYDAFANFRDHLDDRWYYTEEHFHRMGKTFEDAVAEFGFPREWVTAAGLSESQQWRAFRSAQTVGCQINSLFDRYLKKTIIGPDEVTE